MNSIAEAPSRFTIRVSTVFLILSVVGFVLPVLARWSPHDGGAIGLGLMAYVVFPWSAVIAFVASVFYLFRSRSTQSWCELGVSAALIALAGMLYL